MAERLVVIVTNVVHIKIKPLDEPLDYMQVPFDARPAEGVVTVCTGIINSESKPPDKPPCYI
jgi:hypothetical protein